MRSRMRSLDAAWGVAVCKISLVLRWSVVLFRLVLLAVGMCAVLSFGALPSLSCFLRVTHPATSRVTNMRREAAHEQATHRGANIIAKQEIIVHICHILSCMGFLGHPVFSNCHSFVTVT